MNSRQSIRLFVLLVGLSMVFGHSQMRCAKYNKATGACAAPIRNAGVAFMSESHPFTNGGELCQSPMSNPITDSYANGPDCPDWANCPAAMGTYTRGEQFTIMWLARNHAIDNQNPATIKLYMSPKESATQGADVSQSTMQSNLLCQGPYKNCGGQNSDFTPCTLDCTMPNVADGYYTFWWKWDWQTSIYTTCADIIVSGGSSVPATPPPSTPSTPATTARSTTARSTTARSTTARATTGRSTTGRASTTGAAAPNAPATTARSTTGASSQRTTTGAAATPAGGDTPCTLGHQKCVGANNNQYQTCAWKTNTETGWSVVQPCPTGLGCHQVQGNYVWCY